MNKNITTTVLTQYVAVKTHMLNAAHISMMYANQKTTLSAATLITKSSAMVPAGPRRSHAVPLQHSTALLNSITALNTAAVIAEKPAVKQERHVSQTLNSVADMMNRNATANVSPRTTSAAHQNLQSANTPTHVNTTVANHQLNTANTLNNVKSTAAHLENLTVKS